MVVHQSTNLTTNQVLVRIDVDSAVNSKVLRWTRGYPGENTAEGECRECKAVCLPPSLPPNSPSQPPLTPPTYPSTLPPPNTTHWNVVCSPYTYTYVKYSHIFQKFVQWFSSSSNFHEFIGLDRNPVFNIKSLCSIDVCLIHRFPPKWGNMDKSPPPSSSAAFSYPSSVAPVDGLLHPRHRCLHPPPGQQGSYVGKG